MADPRECIIAAERARYRDLEGRTHQTCFFECGCKYEQDGINAEPQLTYCNNHSGERTTDVFDECPEIELR